MIKEEPNGVMRFNGYEIQKMGIILFCQRVNTPQKIYFASQQSLFANLKQLTKEIDNSRFRDYPIYMSYKSEIINLLLSYK